MRGVQKGVQKCTPHDLGVYKLGCTNQGCTSCNNKIRKTHQNSRELKALVRNIVMT